MGLEDFNLFNRDDNTDYTFQDLIKEIHANATDKRESLKALIEKLMSFITSPTDAAVIVPLLSTFFVTAVTNDDALVKLAGVLTRIYQKRESGEVSDLILTDEEKKQLLELSSIGVTETPIIPEDIMSGDTPTTKRLG